MTLIVAMKYEGGVVIASDSMITYAGAPLMREEPAKIETLGNFAITGVGLGGPCERIIEEIKTTFSSGPSPSFEKLIETCEDLMWSFYQKYGERILEERIREGEKITSDSLIVTPKPRMKPFIRAVNVGDTIRGAIRRAGFPWRPYVLRSYFDTQLMLAESKGLVLRDYRQFWMGHKGDIENRYTTNKAKLPESVIEDMRGAYKRSQEYLQTTRSEESSEDRLRQAFREQLLLVAGFSQDEVEQMDVSSVSDEELQTVIKKRLLGEKTDDCTQKVVPVEDVQSYLEQGWEFVASLPNDKVIIKFSEA